MAGFRPCRPFYTKWNRKDRYAVGQAFQPDVSLERLTYTCATHSAVALRWQR